MEMALPFTEQEADKVRRVQFLDNLFDKNYVGSVIVNESNGRYYEPAPNRTLFAGVQVIWKP